MASSLPISGEGPAAQADFASDYLQPTLSHGLRIWWAFYWRNSLVALVLGLQMGAAVQWLGDKGMVSDRMRPWVLQFGNYALSYIPAIFVMYYVLRKRFRTFRIRLTSIGEGPVQVFQPTPLRVFRIWWTFTWRTLVYTFALTVAMTVPMGVVRGTAAAISPGFGKVFGVMENLVVAGAIGLFVIYSHILDEEIADFCVGLVPAAPSASVPAPEIAADAKTDAQEPL